MDNQFEMSYNILTMSGVERKRSKLGTNLGAIKGAVRGWLERTATSVSEGDIEERVESLTNEFLSNPCQKSEDELDKELRQMVSEKTERIVSSRLKSSETVHIVTAALGPMVTTLSFSMTFENEVRNSIRRAAWRAFSMGVDAIKVWRKSSGETVNGEWVWAFRRNLWQLDPTGEDDIRETVVSDVDLLKSNPPLVPLSSVAVDRDFRS